MNYWLINYWEELKYLRFEKVFSLVFIVWCEIISKCSCEGLKGIFTKFYLRIIIQQTSEKLQATGNYSTSINLISYVLISEQHLHTRMPYFSVKKKHIKYNNSATLKWFSPKKTIRESINIFQDNYRRHCITLNNKYSQWKQ